MATGGRTNWTEIIALTAVGVCGAVFVVIFIVMCHKYMQSKRLEKAKTHFNTDTLDVSEYEESIIPQQKGRAQGNLLAEGSGSDGEEDLNTTNPNSFLKQAIEEEYDDEVSSAEARDQMPVDGVTANEQAIMNLI